MALFFWKAVGMPYMKRMKAVKDPISDATVTNRTLGQRPRTVASPVELGHG